MREQPRLRQVPGGWLLAQDLQGAPALPALRLDQHHIAAHRSWGCSTGLQVMAWEGELSVTPGCAVDRCGRTAVLARPFRHRFEEGVPIHVVLALTEVGAAATVLLRPKGRLRDLDIPLASVDSAGNVHDGDGDRQWLRRPGPARRLGGLVPRGAPVTGVASVWKAHVDLAAYRLDGAPAVIASPAGPPADGFTTSTTVEVSSVDAQGFDLVVRHSVSTVLNAPKNAVSTAPHALAWLALRPAERPYVPYPEEWT